MGAATPMTRRRRPRPVGIATRTMRPTLLRPANTWSALCPRLRSNRCSVSHGRPSAWATTPTTVSTPATTRSTLTSHALDRIATGATQMSAATNSQRPDPVRRTASQAAATTAIPPRHHPMLGCEIRTARFTTNPAASTTLTKRRDRSALGSGISGRGADHGSSSVLCGASGGGNGRFILLQRRSGYAASVDSPHTERTEMRVQKSRARCGDSVQTRAQPTTRRSTHLCRF
jgi:hypothetical protein